MSGGTGKPTPRQQTWTVSIEGHPTIVFDESIHSIGWNGETLAALVGEPSRVEFSHVIRGIWLPS